MSVKTIFYIGGYNAQTKILIFENLENKHKHKDQMYVFGINSVHYPTGIYQYFR